jgi:hypothetical protein
MSKHTVASIIKSGVSYDSSWAIYADDCSANAEARIGQTQFDNGGLLDDKKFICTGQQLGDAIQRWTDGEEIDADDLDIDGLLQEEICES